MAGLEESVPGATDTTFLELKNGLRVAQLNTYETSYLFKEIFVDRNYAPDSLPEISPAPVVFDVGANIGLFSLFAAETWPGARIFAFEPAPTVFAALEYNLRRLPCARAERVALGRFPGVTTMSYFPGYTMMSGLRADPEYDTSVARDYLVRAATETEDGLRSEALSEAARDLLAGKFEPIAVQCAVRTLTEVFDESGESRIDLLKIDVERYELDVLLGIEERTWPAIARVVAEIDDQDGALEEAVNLLTEHGMRCVVEQASDYRGSSLYMLHGLS